MSHFLHTIYGIKTEAYAYTIQPYRINTYKQAVMNWLMKCCRGLWLNLTWYNTFHGSSTIHWRSFMHAHVFLWGGLAVIRPLVQVVIYGNSIYQINCYGSHTSLLAIKISLITSIWSIIIVNHCHLRYCIELLVLSGLLAP